MDRAEYPPSRGVGRFLAAASLATLAGLVTGRSLRGAVRLGARLGTAVAVGDYALHRFAGDLSALDEGTVEEIEIQIEEAASDE